MTAVRGGNWRWSLVPERLVEVDKLTVGYQWLSALDFKTLKMVKAIKLSLVLSESAEQ